MLNSTTLIGNLGADPELRYTNAGVPVCNFRIATNEYWRDKDGNKQERAEWHRIVAWGKTAENCGQYLKKGRLVHIDGSIHYRSWTDNDGNKRYTTEIKAKSVLFLPSGSRQAVDENVSNEVNDEVPSADVDPTLNAEAQQVFAGQNDEDVPF